MLETITPIKTNVNLPETLDEDDSYFSKADLTSNPEAIREYYDEHGFVVIRGLISRAMCAQVRERYTADVRESRIPILRQKNMRYERNTLDADGFLANPIFNVQDLGSRSLGPFRKAVLDILTNEATASATAKLLGGTHTKVIQSMFFEAPAGTWAHQDTYYQDSAAGLGGCVAGWFALEDIDAGAGRFYVCPGSHRNVEPLKNAGEYNFATGHAAYQSAMLAMMRANGLALVAPYLAAGDVLFWNSLTVHGSLPASRPGVSRTSLTAHYLRRDDEMLQFHSRIRKQRMTTYNTMSIGLLHDQDLLHNRLIREAAFHLPGPYMTARRLALRTVLATRALRKRLSPGLR